MAQMNRLADKLVIALNEAGAEVTLDRRTFYSRPYHRILTKYTVKERDPISGKNEKLLATYKLSEVVVLLAERYQDITADI